MMTRRQKVNVEIGKFEGRIGDTDDQTATVYVDGVDVGYIERDLVETRERSIGIPAQFRVGGYTLVLWDERAQTDDLDAGTFPTRKEARAFVILKLAQLGSLQGAKKAAQS